MIAMRRMMIRGWGLEAGLRVRMVRPTTLADEAGPSAAEATARYYDAIRDADLRRSYWHRMWLEHGGQS